MENYENWAEIIEELDINVDLFGKSQDCIISLVEKKPRYLSDAQVIWIKDLCHKHGVSQFWGWKT